jgi:hypothetical protein
MVLWIFEAGKALERACEFAMALKYYFAGRIFVARLECHLHCNPVGHRETFEQLKEYKQGFQELYDGLLPMTNAEVSCQIQTFL